MFILYMVLFVAGLYLLGLGMTMASAWVFLGGLAAVCIAVALCFHLPTARERHDV